MAILWSFYNLRHEQWRSELKIRKDDPTIIVVPIPHRSHATQYSCECNSIENYELRTFYDCFCGYFCNLIVWFLSLNFTYDGAVSQYYKKQKYMYAFTVYWDIGWKPVLPKFCFQYGIGGQKFRYSWPSKGTPHWGCGENELSCYYYHINNCFWNEGFPVYWERQLLGLIYLYEFLINTYIDYYSNFELNISSYGRIISWKIWDTKSVLYCRLLTSLWLIWSNMSEMLLVLFL